LILHIKDKTKSMILGRTKATDTMHLTLCGEPVEQTNLRSFNGFRVSTTKGAWDSQIQLTAKLATAKKTSNCIMALRRHNIAATPLQMIQLWQTCVEPHLTYSSEINFDCHKSAMKAISQLETDFFRCCLGLHQRSVEEVMITDLALLPIRERLFYLTIKFYNYAIENTSHLAYAELKDSVALSSKAKHSWY
jgi:hypothetical protein